jgi:superoxide dismutase, Cu-Zn family
MQQRYAAMLAMIAIALSACQSMKDAGSAVFGGSTGPAVGGLLAPLGGSAIEGSVAFLPREGAVTLVVHVTGAGPGVYRVAIHSTGNCSSRNGFSAGPPWAPPGKPPVVVTVATNSEGTATLSTRIAGVVVNGADGILGKSVVVHDGAMGPLDAQPGVPNDRIACAVIGTAPSMF